MQENPICPENWHEDLSSSLDFQKAYDALKGYEHFHTYILKGWMQTYLLQHDEAIENLEKAEKLFDQFEPNADNLRRRFLIFSQSIENRFFLEIKHNTPEARFLTDEAIKKAQLNHEPPNPLTERILLRSEGAYHLLRGEFQTALEKYTSCLEKSNSDAEDSLFPYAGAAAAAHELGYLKEARRHYENLELSLSFTESRLMFYLLSSWLCALCHHWGWENESERWHKTMEVMECSENSKQLLAKRTVLLKDNCKAGQMIPMF